MVKDPLHDEIRSLAVQILSRDSTKDSLTEIEHFFSEHPDKQNRGYLLNLIDTITRKRGKYADLYGGKINIADVKINLISKVWNIKN